MASETRLPAAGNCPRPVFNWAGQILNLWLPRSERRQSIGVPTGGLDIHCSRWTHQGTWAPALGRVSGARHCASTARACRSTGGELSPKDRSSQTINSLRVCSVTRAAITAASPRQRPAHNCITRTGGRPCANWPSRVRGILIRDRIAEKLRGLSASARRRGAVSDMTAQDLAG